MRTCTVIFALLCLIGHAAAQRKGGRMNREEPLSSPATTGPSEPVPAIFFGLHIDHPESEWPPFPFGSYRFWDNFTRWQVVHKELDKFDWERTDYWIHKLDSHGIHDATYALGGSPPWAVNPTANSNSNSNCDYADPSKVRSPGPGYCLPPKDLNSDGTGTNLIWRKAVAGIAGHSESVITSLAGFEVAFPLVERFSGLKLGLGLGLGTTAMAGFAAPTSVITPLAGFAARRPQPPGRRTAIPAAFRYWLAVSRRMRVSC